MFYRKESVLLKKKMLNHIPNTGELARGKAGGQEWRSHVKAGLPGMPIITRDVKRI